VTVFGPSLAPPLNVVPFGGAKAGPFPLCNYDEVVLGDGPVGYWRLDEPASYTKPGGARLIVNDSTGVGNLGDSAFGGTLQLGQVDAPGKLSGTSFLGVSTGGSGTNSAAFVAITTGCPGGMPYLLDQIFDNADFSYEALVKPNPLAFTGATANQYATCVVGTSSPSGGALSTFWAGIFGPLFWTSSGVWGAAGAGWGFQFFPIYMSHFEEYWNTGVVSLDDAWHHIVFTGTAATRNATFYLDGVVRATHNFGPFWLNKGGNVGGVSLGGDSNGGAFAGSYSGVSRIAFYPTVLSAAQVARHYRALTTVA
jgi:hypothetical protein